MRARTSAIVGAILVLSLGVAGCTAQTPSTPGTPPPPATAGPATGSLTKTFGTGTALDYPCDQLLDDVTLATLDAKLQPGANFTPASGSSAEEAVFIKGTACSWLDSSSGTTLIVTAAKPDPDTFASLQSAAGTATTQFGQDVAAYTSGTELQLFTLDGYWATADSDLLSDPAKLTQVGQVLLEELPAG